MRTMIGIAAILLLLLLLNVSSFSIVNFYSTVEEELFSNTSNIVLGFNGSFSAFKLGGRVLLSNDNKFYSGHSRFYFGYYFYADRGWISWNFDHVNIKLGKFEEKDVIKSPYSLFINSEGIPLVGTKISYENNWFFYTTRWMQLTKETSVDNLTYSYSFPDRGAVLKIFGLKIGKFELGYEESTVFVGRTFDFEYFFSILPTFFIQYTNFEEKPYRQGTNDNSIMGFFASYQTQDMDIYAQILVDDFNVNRFMFPESYQNPDKIAWAIGCVKGLGNINIYFHHAGATKYTFEPTVPGIPYGYVHFPSTIYPVKDATAVLYPEDNYIGFKYGENVLAFMGGLEMKISNTLLLDLGGEAVFSGSKSYNNPWHELKSFPNGTHLFDDELINETHTIWFKISKKFDFGEVYTNLIFKSISNPFTVVQGADGDGEILMPIKGNQSFLKFIVGISAYLNISK